MSHLPTLIARVAETVRERTVEKTFARTRQLSPESCARALAELLYERDLVRGCVVANARTPLLPAALSALVANAMALMDDWVAEDLPPAPPSACTDCTDEACAGTERCERVDLERVERTIHQH